MSDKARERFEVWAQEKRRDLKRDGEGYYWPGVQARWEAWQQAWKEALADKPILDFYKNNTSQKHRNNRDE